MWYDAAGRLTDTAVLPAPVPSTRPGSVPARTAALVASQSYDGGGWLEDSTDPMGYVTHRVNDSLGRVKMRIDAFTGGFPTLVDNRRVEYQYTPLDQIRVVKTVLPGGASRETVYTYGASPDRFDTVDSSDLLATIRYPLDDQSAYGSQIEVQRHNALGELIGLDDRNGVRHTYQHDTAGRVTADLMAVPAGNAGMDGSVTSIGTSYDTLGRPERIVSGGSAPNEVRRVYNGFGQLVEEYQEHAGTARVGGPNPSKKVTYVYAAGPNSSRLAGMMYPDGTAITYTADPSVGFERVKNVADATGVLEQYDYLGLSTPVARSRPQARLSQSYAADSFAGLDAFGRPVNLTWQRSGGAADDAYWMSYGYDRNSNVTLRDGITLDAFGYDKLGRVTTYTHDESDNGSALHNYGVTWAYDANETPRWTNPSFDPAGYTVAGSSVYRAGDHKAIRKDGRSPNTHAGRTFDALDRLTHDRRETAKAPSTGPATGPAFHGESSYRYDGLGRVTSIDGRDVYYGADGKPVQDGADRYVWSPVTGHPIAWDRAPVTAGAPHERLQVLTDAEGSTVAVTDAAGAALEVYTYNPFGDVTPRDRGFDPLASSSLHFPLLHGGRYYDWETELYVGGAGGAYDAKGELNVRPSAAAYAAGRNAYAVAGLSEMVARSMEGWREDVGMAEGFVPVWGSGKQAYHNFGRGEWVQGLANTYLAATDAVGVGLLGKAIGKMTIGGIGRSIFRPAGSDIAESLSQGALKAVADGTLNNSILTGELRRVGTKRSSMIADLIESGKVDIRWHDTAEELQAFYARARKSNMKPGVKAYFSPSEGAMHLVRDKNAFQNAVHEGVHAAHWRVRTYGDEIRLIKVRDKFWEELQANGAEQEFLAAAGLGRTMVGRFQVLSHVAGSYSEHLRTAAPETLAYLKRLGVIPKG